MSEGNLYTPKRSSNSETKTTVSVLAIANTAERHVAKGVTFEVDEMGECELLNLGLVPLVQFPTMLSHALTLHFSGGIV